MDVACSIVTGAALKEMVVPGVLAVGLPVAVGLIFRNFSESYQAGAAIYWCGRRVCHGADDW